MTSPILLVEHVEAVYAKSILALRDVSLAVEAGSMVALLGANGAGKTTTLKAISRLLSVERGEVTRGTLSYRGQDIRAADPADLVALGLVQVLEGRRCFPHLSVEENLVMGAISRRLGAEQRRAQLAEIYALFPRLGERRKGSAGYLSGGEQQMLAIGRALMAEPTLILLDEPSMGLAPQIVEEIFEILADLNRRRRVSFLIAEQNAAIALAYADHAYVLETGRVVRGGPARELLSQSDLQSFYLGGAEGAERSALERPRRPEFALPVRQPRPPSSPA
jgi:branched-chain amino acid transport system ATP-binding protein